MAEETARETLKLAIVDCKSCGHQVEYAGEPGEICLFCDRRIDGKNEPPPSQVLAQEKDSPPKSGTKKPYFDKRREAILVDYGLMCIAHLEKKWQMARGYFYFLRHRWENEGFTIPTAYVDKEVALLIGNVNQVKCRRCGRPFAYRRNRKKHEEQCKPAKLRPSSRDELRLAIRDFHKLSKKIISLINEVEKENK